MKMPVNLKKSRLTFSEYQREARREARNERIKEAAAYIAMAALFVAVFIMGIIGLEREFEFKERQDRCWAEEARTGADLDCQDDETW
jgi:hypothetical protein